MLPLTTIACGPFRWQLVDGPERETLQTLLGPHGILLDQAQIQIVKQAPHRSVHRVLYAGLDLHVKHYHGDRRDWFRCLFRGRRAAREFALTREVAARGVPTIEVLGYGEFASRLGPSESVLLTRTLPHTRPLIDFLETTLPAMPAKLEAMLHQRLAVALGKLLACKHRAGVRHEDLHPGNLLIRVDQGQIELFLIDLDSVSLGRPMGWSASRENLVVLDRWFALRGSRSDRRRAWRAYVQQRTELHLDERLAARELAWRTHTTLLGHVGGMDDRCQGGNRHFSRIRHPGRSGYHAADLDLEVLKKLLTDPDRPFDTRQGTVLKESATSVVLELPSEQGPLVYKRIPGRPWLTGLLSLLRPPPALRAYLNGNRLRLRGLPTPRPLAVWHRQRFGLLKEGYLLCEKLPASRPLGAFVDFLSTRPMPERNCRLWALADELGRLLRLLHDWRLSHRDLKAANILISPQQWKMGSRGVIEYSACLQQTRDRVWFIDLVGVRKHVRLLRGRRVRDLARLHMSFLQHRGLTRTDRLRLLRSYLMWSLRGKEGWKKWWRDIHAATCTKVARNLARGRVIG